MTGRAFDPGPPVDYGWAGDWLDSYVRARTRYDGDAWVSLFADEAEFRPDPFEPQLTGANQIRAYLLERSEAEADLELTIERHWVSGPTVLAAWHASFTQRPDRARVRQAGFMTAETSAGRCSRLRIWAVTMRGAG